MHKNLLRQSETYGIVSRKHQLFNNMTLATVSLCLTLIIVEFALRSFIPLDSRRPFEFRIPHPTLGWVLQPNTTYLYKIPEGPVSVTYNSAGWRDLEHALEKPAGVFRILVLGDSFMEANSVQLDSVFHRQLEALARAAGYTHVEVINMGVSGYGTLQEYLVFQNIGQLYKPDLVLVGFYLGNDVQNNSLQLASILADEGQVPNARPFLELSESGRWTITPVDFEGAQSSYAKNKASLEAKENKLTEKLAFFKLFTTGIERLLMPELLTNQGNQLEPIEKSRYEMALMGVNYCVEPIEYTQAWDATKRIFARFREEVDAYGSKLIVFTVPAMEEVSAEYMKAVRADVAHPDRLCHEEAPGHARLSAILIELDIEQISLLPEFRRVTREDGINLYQSDLHWNPEGHAVAAERVLSELIRRGLLP